MAACEFIETCIFFNGHMANMPSTGDTFRKLYCKKDFAKCARYMVVQAKGRGSVPSDLFPNQTDRANSIIAG